MWDRFICKSVVLIAALLLIAPLDQIRAQEKHFSDVEPASRPRRTLTSGIITERLSARDLRRWLTIKDIVFFKDEQGRRWHPTLVKLWEQLEASGHAIYIEFAAPRRSISSMGGLFSIEQFDPRGIRHEALIRLYLDNIDHAYVGPASARPDGFIPFTNLSREERYAEVLGHELAHAVWVFSNLKRTEIVNKLVKQTNELFLARREWIDTDQELDLRIFQRDLLLEELEAQAEALESVIWLELVCSQNARAGKSCC